jgi:hypothetical protein
MYETRQCACLFAPVCNSCAFEVMLSRHREESYRMKTERDVVAIYASSDSEMRGRFAGPRGNSVYLTSDVVGRRDRSPRFIVGSL